MLRGGRAFGRCLFSTAVAVLLAPLLICSFTFTLTLLPVVSHATVVVCKAVGGTLFLANQVVADTFSLALQTCDVPVVDSPTERVGHKISAADSAIVDSVATDVWREAQQLSLYDVADTSKLIHEVPFPMADLGLASARVLRRAPAPVLGEKNIRENKKVKVVDKKKLPAMAKIFSSRARVLAPEMQSVAENFDIDPLLLHAIAHVESRHNPNAISPAGARGLMQVMPMTARRFGVNDPERELHDPLVNLRVSSAYLKVLQGLFGNDLSLVLAAYNAGENAVIKYGRKIPPYRETQGYVRAVMDQYLKLRSLRSSVEEIVGSVSR